MVPEALFIQRFAKIFIFLFPLLPPDDTGEYDMMVKHEQSHQLPNTRNSVSPLKVSSQKKQKKVRLHQNRLRLTLKSIARELLSIQTYFHT